MIPANDCELLIIGAGPAGLAAATTAAQLGVRTVLLDEQSAVGGQIYRAITRSPLNNRAILGNDYWHGESLIEPFRNSGAQYEPGATVWAVSRMTTPEPPNGFEIAYSVDGQARMLTAKHVLLATGAQERPFPIPGWTLPGVLMAGAAQIMLKSAGMVPGQRTMLAGCGPLLYLLAWQYLNAGVKVDALLDTTPAGRLGKALPQAWDFLRSPYLAKGLKLIREVKANTRIIKHVTSLEASGESELTEIRYATGNASLQTLAADLLLLHQGVMPNINLAQAMGAELRWNNAQKCWEPKVDDWGNSTVQNVSLAGDSAGIAGAQAAEHRGRLAGLDAARQLGKIDLPSRDSRSAPHREALAKAIRGRDFLDILYQPADVFRLPKGDTIVCRCEEVTAQQVRETVKLGCPGPNQMKSFLRCGMGPCQGRFCNVTVTELIAQERGVSPAEVGHYRLRFPTKPLTLGELASLPQTDDSRQAVIRVAKAP
ncbi:FAD/NAD(P)-dependent oxidoreductase [Pollutimonas bauzanensis]|uniref:NADPH-dependent 2,4-dienoyl-CoA reductase, sulfur reductase n=1 Tax=Pollutimonas bauzanensis TaxID=658167 RepID=A0A1M6AI43_9BURK|nr:NAD(P)/FAD-dependent oxidoreductase [Pollutimonas bauzanensis]SHI36170.1 NADPH-dependent 2,4-dienoyl-CoA reductase, sulfur reductase [Pollutimonas bauzanensis]